MPTPATQIEIETRDQKHSLGFWMLTALVAGNMIGSGIFLLPPALANYGMYGTAGWFVTATGALILGLVFARLSQVTPRVGGPYAFCRDAFGDFAGSMVAYNYWIAQWVGNAAIAVAFVGYMAVFFPVLISTSLSKFIAAVCAVWFLTIINILGVRHAGFVQLLTTVLKLMPLVVVGTVGYFYIDIKNLTAPNISGQSGMTALSSAATLTLWAFIGLESATVPASEVNNPKRNIPLATIVGVVATAVVYIASSVAVIGIVPTADLLHSNAPYADAAKIMFGTIGQWLIAAGAAISAFGTLNGWILLQARVPYAASLDGLFPKVFSKLSPMKTPYVSLIVSSSCTTLLLLLTLGKNLMAQFEFVTLLAVFSNLIPYLFSSMAILILYFKHRAHFGKQLFASILILGILGFLYSFWAFYGAGKEIVFYGALLFFTGVPVYVWNWIASKRV